MNSYGNGIPAGFVTMRPGTRLIQRDVTTDNTVYAVETNGILRPITTANAIALYGSTWASRVTKVSDQNFLSYTVSTSLPTGQYPIGTLLKKTTGADVFYFDGTNYRRIANEAAFNANRFNARFIVKTSMSFNAGGSEITGMESGLINAAQNGGTIVTPPVVLTGSVMAALASDSPVAASIPTNTSVEMMKFNLTAGNDSDASISSIKLSAIGLGNYGDIDEVTIYADGAKLGNSRDVDSNKVAQINFTNALVIAKGTTKTLTVKAKVASTQNYGLSINQASDISATANVAGSFPVKSNIMSGVGVTVGALTFDNDGSLSNVKLGDSAATVAKFKVTNNNVEDVVLKTVSLKKDSSSTASDSDMNNYKLFVDGNQVATAASISNKYVTFVFASPVSISKNNVKRFTVKADVVSGAGKTMKFMLDASADINAVGSFYGYNTLVNNNMTGASVIIDAGKVTLEKVNATVDKLKKDTNDTILGTFKITVNSGKSVEMSKLNLNIKSVNDSAATSSAFTQIENVEVFNKTSNTTYDMSYSSGTSTKVYRNTSMGLMLNSGTIYELVVRADVKATATDGDYEVSIANAGTDMTLKETGNDTIVTDITPNSLTLKKVVVYAPAIAFSTNALSASYSAVAGTADVEVLNFNAKANESSDLKITELKIAKNSGTATVNSSVVSEFKLWKGATLLKSVSGSQIASEEAAFSDLNETITANTTGNYRVTASLVKDSSNNGKTMKFRLSGYSVEETDKGTAAYDATSDSNKDGVIAANTMVSGREVSIVGTGALYVSVDKTITGFDKDAYVKAGASDISVASLKLKAANEDVKVTKVKVTTGATGLNTIINKLALYDGSTLVAETSNISDITEFTNTNFVVPQSEKVYTLKASFNKIGKDQAGVVDQDLAFTFQGIEAEGNASGDTLAADTTDGVLAGEIAYANGTNSTFGEAADTTTAASNKTGIVSNKLTTVSLENSYNGVSVASSISSGVYANAAIIKVTTDASDNTLSNGDVAKALINKIKLQIETNATTTDVSIEKIGGSQSAVTTSTITNGYAQLSVSGTDYELAPATTAYYLVKVKSTFTGTYAGQFSIKTNLDNLNGTDATLSANGGNIIWQDSSAATAKNDLRLSTSNYSGTLIKN